MSNGFDIEPCDFPQCNSCKSSYDVDIDEIQSDNRVWVFVCRKCYIQWGRQPHKWSKELE
jgi:hypothetical protein